MVLQSGPSSFCWIVVNEFINKVAQGFRCFFNVFIDWLKVFIDLFQCLDSFLSWFCKKKRFPCWLLHGFGRLKISCFG